MGELFTTRREMMAVPLFAAAFAMFRAESVKAAGVDPTMTMHYAKVDFALLSEIA